MHGTMNKPKINKGVAISNVIFYHDFKPEHFNGYISLDQSGNNRNILLSNKNIVQWGNHSALQLNNTKGNTTPNNYLMTLAELNSDFTIGIWLNMNDVSGTRTFFNPYSVANMTTKFVDGIYQFRTNEGLIEESITYGANQDLFLLIRRSKATGMKTKINEDGYTASWKNNIESFTSQPTTLFYYDNNTVQQWYLNGKVKLFFACQGYLSDELTVQLYNNGAGAEICPI
jgi:hypothetical protein